MVGTRARLIAPSGWLLRVIINILSSHIQVVRSKSNDFVSNMLLARKMQRTVYRGMGKNARVVVPCEHVRVDPLNISSH